MVDGIMINSPVVTIDGLTEFGSWALRYKCYSLIPLWLSEPWV